jgi:hypothetical protein
MIPPTPPTSNVIPINRLATSGEFRMKSMPVNLLRAQMTK